MSALTKTDQPIVDDPIRTALAAAIKGEDPEKAVYGKDTGMYNDSGSVDDYEPLESGTSPLDKIEQELDSEPEQATEQAVEPDNQETEKSAETPDLLSQVTEPTDDSTPDIEVVKVKGEFTEQNPEGRSVELKIDYSDRKAIKKAFVQASGMRRAFTKQQQLTKQVKDIQKQLTDSQSDWSKLESAWTENGVKGVVGLLSQGNPNAWSEAVNAEIEQRQYIANLSPEDRYQHDLNEQKRLAALENDKIKQEYQSLLDKQRQAEEQAAEKQLQCQLYPTFDRYRFQGKLGDPVAEQEFDESLWMKVTNRLADYPDDIELTQAMIDKEFRTIATRMRKHLNVQAEKKVSALVNKKKSEASNRAQVIAKKGLSGSSAKRDFVNKMKSGDLKGGFMDMITGKVKL